MNARSPCSCSILVDEKETGYNTGDYQYKEGYLYENIVYHLILPQLVMGKNPG